MRACLYYVVTEVFSRLLGSVHLVIVYCAGGLLRIAGWVCVVFAGV